LKKSHPIAAFEYAFEEQPILLIITENKLPLGVKPEHLDVFME
jgi:hypothetical protein